jgi:ubiquinone/menaquinone biosynthesis C-methylase UbiE
MKEKTIEYLSCPNCKTSGFSLNVYDLKNQEILSGKLLCKKCGKDYQIVNGIPNTIIQEYIKRPNRLSAMFYNLYAPLYDSLEGFFGKFSRLSEAEIRENSVKRLELSEADIVLEVATGTGRNIPIIRKYTKGTIFGLDLSEGMLRRYLEKKRKYGWEWEIELFCGNSEYLPFKANSFDAVLNFGGMTCFSDAREAINEMYRVAKPESKIVIFEQITNLEKFLGRDKPLELELVKLVPKDAIQVRVEYIFGGNFYVIEFKKVM